MGEKLLPWIPALTGMLVFVFGDLSGLSDWLDGTSISITGLSIHLALISVSTLILMAVKSVLSNSANALSEVKKLLQSHMIATNQTIEEFGNSTERMTKLVRVYGSEFIKMIDQRRAEDAKRDRELLEKGLEELKEEIKNTVKK